MDPLHRPFEAKSTYRLSPGAVLGICVVLAPTVVLFGWTIRSLTGLRHTLLVILISALSIFLLWLLIRLGETIVVAEDDISVRIPFLGTSRIRWADVTGVEVVDGRAVGRAFRLTSGVTRPIRIGDFVAGYEDVLADVLKRVPARVLSHAFADAPAKGPVREQVEAAMASRARFDDSFIGVVREVLEGRGLSAEAAALEQRIVARPQRDVVDSATEQNL